MRAKSIFLSPRPRYEPRMRYLNTSVDVFKYLDRGFVKPAIPRSRYLNTSTEVFRYLGRGFPRPRCVFLFLPKFTCQKVLPRSVDSPTKLCNYVSNDKKLHVQQFSVRGFRRIMSFDTLKVADTTPPYIFYKT